MFLCREVSLALQAHRWKGEAQEIAIPPAFHLHARTGAKFLLDPPQPLLDPPGPPSERLRQLIERAITRARVVLSHPQNQSIKLRHHWA
jgi:hypothetical protein